jgi:hypothetical protein
MTAPLLPGTCEWTLDDGMGLWATSCDQAFQFDVEGPTENKFAFCPYCGLKLAEVRPEPDPADSDV